MGSNQLAGIHSEFPYCSFGLFIEIRYPRAGLELIGFICIVCVGELGNAIYEYLLRGCTEGKRVAVPNDQICKHELRYALSRT